MLFSERNHFVKKVTASLEDAEHTECIASKQLLRHSSLTREISGEKLQSHLVV